MDYQRFTDKALQLITKYGRGEKLKIRRVSSGTPRNPVYGPEENVDIRVLEMTESHDKPAGSMVSSKKNSFLVANTPEVEENMAGAIEISVNGRWLTISDAKPLRPGNVIILWEIFVNG